MTREEQLDWLYRLRSEIYVYMPKEWLIPMNNALDTAIKALEQEPVIRHNGVKDELNRVKNELEPTTKNDLGVDWESYKDADGNSLDDLILEVLQNNFDCGNTYGYKVADEIIELLPSVTPQEPQTFEWCDTCKEYDQEKHCCHRWSKVIRDTVEEMKQEPKSEWQHDHELLKAYSDGANEVLDKIRAEIEPKCDRINSLASVLPYTAHREIQELLCEIMDLCKAESEPQEDEDALNVGRVVVTKTGTKDCVICYSCDERDDYETRLKADMVAMLTEIQLEIEELDTPNNGSAYMDCAEIIQQKINALKGEGEK